MTVHLHTAPVYAVRCDVADCTAEHVPAGAWLRTRRRLVRLDAERAGWQVRPEDGPGARTAPDYCPTHARTRGGELG